VACQRLDAGRLPVCTAWRGWHCDHEEGAELKAHALELDAAEARACLDALVGAGCLASEYVLANDPHCSSALRPNAQLGEHCAFDADCVAGHCSFSFQGCASCVAYLQAGEPCDANEQRCDPSQLWCPTAMTTPVCQPLLVAGKPCKSGDSCQSRHCADLTDGGASCAPLATNATCFESDACAASEWCSGLDPAQNGTCKPRVATGSPCVRGVYDDGCADPEAWCLDGKCARVEVSSLGLAAQCREDWQCAPGLFCGGKSCVTCTGTCRAQSPIGRPCSAVDFQPCADGAACVGLTCRPLGGPGASCSTTSYTDSCEVALRCIGDGGTSGVCLPLGVPLDPCGITVDCAASFCDFSATPPRCAAALDAGAACLGTGDCEAELTCTGPSGSRSCERCLPER
jgi:hypothetical protein